MISVDVELRLKSPNAMMAEHYRSRANRRAQERSLTLRALEPFEAPQLVDGKQLTVTFTRVGPLKLDDDNLAFAFKSVRDATADWMGIDDADPRVRWEYRQQKLREKTLIKVKRVKKAGLRVYCRIDVDAEAKDAEPILERMVAPGEVPLRRHPPIDWITQPGVDLGDIPVRANGSQLRIVRKSLTGARKDGRPYVHTDYVHAAVYFQYKGKPLRTQGVAILLSEIDAVIDALKRAKP